MRMSAFFALFVTSSLVSLKVNNALRLSMNTETLYDMPVSNHGARVRMVIASKKIAPLVRIAQPSEIGGLKSAEYLSLNLQGKMPLLVCPDGMPIPESDTICRYLMDKYPQGPSFSPSDLKQRVLSDQICRLHDMYLAPVQGCMYKPPGFTYSTFGSDRTLALAELKKQLFGIEAVVAKFDAKFPSLSGNFLCGKDISLADASLYPTIVFCMFMLPEFFGWDRSDILGQRLSKWWDFMSNEVPEARTIRNDIENALSLWRANGRWDPIIDEMQALKSRSA